MILFLNGEMRKEYAYEEIAIRVSSIIINIIDERQLFVEEKDGNQHCE